MKKDQLIANFNELFQIEKQAHDYYENMLLSDLGDNQRRSIQEIHDDEERHMVMAKNIIRILEEEL